MHEHQHSLRDFTIEKNISALTGRYGALFFSCNKQK